MTCQHCNQPINYKANQVSITAAGVNFHIECAIDLDKSGDYHKVIKQASAQRRAKKYQSKRFLPGLGYI